jgi:hypothetical protein
MSLKSQNIPLQSGVDFMITGKEGSAQRDTGSYITTYEFGVSMNIGDKINFGGGCIIDTDYGVRPPISTDTVGMLKGFAVYENTGMIDDAGYVKGGLFYSIGVCELGKILLPVVSNVIMNPGDTVYLYYGTGSTDPDYNKITNISTNAIDISSKVSVAKTSNQNLALCTLVKYAGAIS